MQVDNLDHNINSNIDNNNLKQYSAIHKYIEQLLTIYITLYIHKLNRYNSMKRRRYRIDGGSSI